MRSETGRAPDREGQGRREDRHDSGINNSIPPTSDIENQLAEYARWLAEHRDDPQLVAGCARLGRLLGGVA